ncbi:MAG: GMC family oxidoreductase [Candidatus Omnitrophica bacterium]|nr:GMC family oxidoreductase [Candidatus Omnitrophota bacterium]
MPVDYLPQHPEREHWDVIIVGTGMGGSTVGYELARRGRRVLFLEKGKLLHGDPGASVPPPPAADLAELRMGAGCWPLPLQGETSFGKIEFYAPWGCGSGGSTSIYGAQLERFSPADFRPRANFPDVPDANLPERWPISYDELVPYYRRAEALYRVYGTPDPLNPDPDTSLRVPPPLSARDQVLYESFLQLGLHPYRSHVGFDYGQACRECLRHCAQGCKSDAGRVCLMPALTHHGARILPECEVLALVADNGRVSAVRGRWKGAEITIPANAVVLAAGALMTPLLLLNSRSSRWANGLANRSGQVGRNLMLHTSDYVAIDPGEWYSAQGPVRAVALNDFYVDDGQKLGNLQSLGFPEALGPSFMLEYLRFIEVKEPHWWRRLTHPFLPLVARLAPRVLRRASLFATIVEDLPLERNRILPDPNAWNGMRFEYQYTRELWSRNRRFRKRIAEVLSSRHRVTVVTGSRNNLNYGHVCGTCRFGEDPATSVLDGTNRAHDLDNLYVVDASFFPSSGGTNPSLTIAANALRVGGIIHDRLP